MWFVLLAARTRWLVLSLLSTSTPQSLGMTDNFFLTILLFFILPPSSHLTPKRWTEAPIKSQIVAFKTVYSCCLQWAWSCAWVCWRKRLTWTGTISGSVTRAEKIHELKFYNMPAFASKWAYRSKLQIRNLNYRFILPIHRKEPTDEQMTKQSIYIVIYAYKVDFLVPLTTTGNSGLILQPILPILARAIEVFCIFSLYFKKDHSFVQ